MTCVVLQPYDMEVGAGTFHPATTLRSLGPKPWKAAYVQPSDDQQMVGMVKTKSITALLSVSSHNKTISKNIKQLYLKSLATIGIDVKIRDIRFVEDDWESPTLGCSRIGLGGLVRWNGDYSIHLFSTNDRNRMQTCFC